MLTFWPSFTIGLLVDDRALVGAAELDHLVDVDFATADVDADALGVELDDDAAAVCDEHVTRVDSGAMLETGADERRLR